jgi:hypothetical protein
MRAHLPNEQDSIRKYQFLYHFIPHEVKRKRANLLSQGALITYSIILLILVVILRVFPLMAPGVLGYASNINSNDLLKYTNERRAKVGLKPLKMNAELSRAAEKKAEDMFDVGYWAHVSPLGTQPWDFILSQGYDYTYAGENLAKNFSNSKEVVDAWYESPSHRENLLSSNYDDIGFAVVNGVLNGYETTLVVQMFGRLRQPSYLASSGGTAGGAPAPPEEQKTVYEPATEQSTTPAGEPSGNEAPETLAQKPSHQEEQELKGQPQQLEEELAYVPENNQVIEKQPVFDVKTVTKSISLVFGGFVTTLLGIDLWYSKRHGILKLSGHTLAHLIFLLVILASVMISVFPGSIL